MPSFGMRPFSITTTKRGLTMHIIVSGKHMDVGDSLRSHIEGKLSNEVGKYLDRINNVNVVITKESNQFRADINANPGTHAGIVIKGRAEAGDVYAAFDAASEKIAKQLRRYKRKLTNHHKPSVSDLPIRSLTGKKYVLADGHDEVPDAPVVIAEKPTHIDTLSVSEAVMRMDLSDLPALLFFNAGSGRINVVYRRADGNISWVDPEEKAA